MKNGMRVCNASDAFWRFARAMPKALATTILTELC